jgi:hypothetical protein
MFRINKSNFTSKIIPFIILMGLVLSPAISFAQDEACGGDDPTGGSTVCPLDTWVWVLVIAAVVFGTLRLYHRQKLQSQA